jgi:hypothetical protein
MDSGPSQLPFWVLAYCNARFPLSPLSLFIHVLHQTKKSSILFLTLNLSSIQYPHPSMSDCTRVKLKIQYACKKTNLQLHNLEINLCLPFPFWPLSFWPYHKTIHNNTPYTHINITHIIMHIILYTKTFHTHYHNTRSSNVPAESKRAFHEYARNLLETHLALA